MDTRAPANVEVDLYEADELAWLESQSRALREGRLGELDRDRLAEVLDDMGKSLTRELKSRLGVLVAHIIKLHVQPERYSGSWRGTIREQQRQIRQLLVDAPSLRRFLPELFVEAHRDAIEIAADDIGMRDEAIREVLTLRPPLTVEEVLAFEPPELNP